MLFNSFSFILLFLPAALIGFFAISRMGQTYGAIWLILASFVFYGIWNPRFILLLLLSIAFNFMMGEFIHAAVNRTGRQKLFLALAIAVDLLVLGYYKYFYALLSFVGSIGLADVNFPKVILPLGISFFTFTQIGYLVDIQQGVTRERGLLNYILFVTFFPHLIAGPILHNRDIMPQFSNSEIYRFSLNNFTCGFVIFVIGLAKKCILADPISGNVQAAFAAPQQLSLFTAWFAALSFAFQLYFDFSGYSDMAIGIARMFNLRFPINFNSPFKATSIIDHWHRWHMTLSRFLNLYLFSPIALAMVRHRVARGRSVNREAQKTPAGFAGMVAFPILVTMGLAGIWHGAGIQYLIFGLLHGSYLTINHAWRLIRPFKQTSSWITTCASFAITFTAVLIALVFLRAPTLSTATTMLSGMAGLHGLGLPATALPYMPGAAANAPMEAPDGIKLLKALHVFLQNAIGVVWIAILGIIIWAFPNTQEIMSRYERGGAPLPYSLLSWRPTLGWAAAIGAISAVSLLALEGTTEFLYYQF